MGIPFLFICFIIVLDLHSGHSLHTPDLPIFPGIFTIITLLVCMHTGIICTKQIFKSSKSQNCNIPAILITYIALTPKLIAYQSQLFIDQLLFVAEMQHKFRIPQHLVNPIAYGGRFKVFCFKFPFPIRFLTD